MSRDAPELPEGLNLLDRYTIVDHIGGGGMADIYRAHDSRLDRIVCVKLLRNIIQQEGGSTSGGIVYQATYTHFLQEARSLSKLAHPNTLRIYDFGFLQLDSDDSSQVQPRPFQIAEYLDGGNLETYVRTRGTLKPVEVLAILDRVGGAVAEAHEVGIIHRDIKPSNILFSRVGDVLMPKLADFGIARTVRRRLKHSLRPPGSPSTTDTQEVVPPIPLFSPRWAAPEQLSAGEEGSFTDVYGLGLVIGFMLSGKSLFEVPDVTATFGDRVQGDQYVRQRLALHSYAPEVARVLMNALRADSRARTQSPFELYEALSQAFGTPRTSLPLPVAHSGGVPQAKAQHQQDTGSVQASFVKREKAAQSIEPPEQWLQVGGRQVRLVETHEKLDLKIPPRGLTEELRLRVTLLPSRGPQFRVNFKGLSCFIGRPGGAASPAIVADADGTGELVSAKKERVGGLRWSFGTVRGNSRVFPIATGELVVPFPQGECALAVELSPDREVIVICRRP
jgi:serine/threonine protein kinase